MRKPSDFATTFKPTYLSLTEYDRSKEQCLVEFDGNLDSQGQVHAIHVSHPVLVAFAYDVLRKLALSPEYETLRILKKIENVLSTSS